MNKIAMGVLAGLLAGCVCDKCACRSGADEDPEVGNWGAKLPYDSMYAGSFVFSHGADGSAKVFVLGRFPVAAIEILDGLRKWPEGQARLID